MQRFSLTYFLLFLSLFLIEVLIAAYAGGIIRAYFGDVLVVILLYAMVKSFWDVPAPVLSLLVLLFSYLIETLQYFNIVVLLGLGHLKLARIIIGTDFSWIDILSYTLGIFIVLVAERWNGTRKAANSVPLFL
jgi:hypothetical protein